MSLIRSGVGELSKRLNLIQVRRESCSKAVALKEEKIPARWRGTGTCAPDGQQHGLQRATEQVAY